MSHNDLENFSKLLNDNNISDRKNALNFTNDYFSNSFKQLKQFGSYAPCRINLSWCFDKCTFKVILKQSLDKKKNNCFYVDLQNTNLKHGVIGDNNITGLCSGTNKITTVRVIIII